LIEKRPDLVRTFVKAYVEAIQQFKTNRPLAFRIIARSSGLTDQADIEEYFNLLTTRFLLDYPLPSVTGMKTVLDDLGAKNPKIRDVKPEDLLDTRFLRELKTGSAVR
jgi:ABC-type nitrate/sulfonate/bicarbonate transport system substrate-binding protein